MYLIWTPFYLFVWKALQCRYSCGLSCFVCFWDSFTAAVFNYPLHKCVCIEGRGSLFETKSHYESACLQTVNLSPLCLHRVEHTNMQHSRKNILLYSSVLLFTDIQVGLVIFGLGCHNQSFNKHLFVKACRHGSNYIHHLILWKDVNGLENYFSLLSLPTRDIIELIQLKGDKFYCLTGHVIYLWLICLSLPYCFIWHI